MNNTAIARLALEGGLGIGTVTGGAYAAEYGRELTVQQLKAEGSKDKIEATEGRWRKWMIYTIACLNSINKKGGGNGHSGGTAQSATQEARDCKSHIQQNLQTEVSEGVK